MKSINHPVSPVKPFCGLAGIGNNESSLVFAHKGVMGKFRSERKASACRRVIENVKRRKREENCKQRDTIVGVEGSTFIWVKRAGCADCCVRLSHHTNDITSHINTVYTV